MYELKYFAVNENVCDFFELSPMVVKSGSIGMIMQTCIFLVLLAFSTTVVHFARF